VPDELATEVQVRSLYGRLLSRGLVPGAPLDLGLSGRSAVVLTRGAHAQGTRVGIVDAGTGTLRRFLAAPSTARGPVSARDGRAAFVAGGTIRVLDLASGQIRLAAFARGKLVGVAMGTSRVFWAENLGKTGRIRALSLGR
jgi:hypothetical protein